MSMDLPIAHRLVLGFTCIFIVLGLVAISAGGDLAKTRQAADVVTKQLIPQVDAANELAVAVGSQRTGLRGYITTGEQIHYDEYRQALSSERSAIATLKANTAGSHTHSLVLEMESTLDRMHQVQEESLKRLESGSSRSAYAYHVEHIRPAAEEIAGLCDQLSSEALERINEASLNYNLAMESMTKNAAWSLLAALVLALGFVIATVRSVTVPAGSIALAAGAVSSGDYQKAISLEERYCRRVTSKGKDRPNRSELRRIASALAEMARRIERRELAISAHSGISSICASTIETGDLLDGSLEGLVDYTSSQIGAVYLSQDGQLRPVSTYGLSSAAADAALTGPEGLVEQVASSGKAIVLSDIPDDTSFSIRPGLGKMTPAAIACIPMVVEGSSLGVIVLASLNSYGSDMIRIMEIAASQIGVALSNALRHLSVRQLAEELSIRNEQLDAQNEELQCQNEEIQSQSEEIQVQSQEIQAQNQMLMEQKRVLQEIYEHQRSIAQTLQKSFLPGGPAVVSGLDIGDAYIPAQEDAQVGGDFYDLIEFGDGQLGVVIGDVSGKGVGAAVHTAMAKYMLRGFAHEDREPASVLCRLNEAINRYVSGDMFITLFYGVLDTHKGTLVYGNAGHEYPLIVKGETGECTSLASTGAAIGIIPGMRYTQATADLNKGDAFILYTDGITEARRGKDFFGFDNFKRMVSGMGALNADEITTKILAHVREYTDNKLHDDVALLAIKPHVDESSRR